MTPKSETYNDAFYKILSNTLVCADVKLASRIGLEDKIRRRVVTLEGELIEASGVMSGGGKPKKGGMSQRIVEDYTLDQVNAV